MRSFDQVANDKKNPLEQREKENGNKGIQSGRKENIL